MATATLARPVQSPFPYTTEQAIHAAKLWFVQRKPSMSLAAWRDHLLSVHLKATRTDDWRERIERTQAWNDAFARGVAASIGGGNHD